MPKSIINAWRVACASLLLAALLPLHAATPVWSAPAVISTDSYRIGNPVFDAQGYAYVMLRTPLGQAEIRRSNGPASPWLPVAPPLRCDPAGFYRVRFAVDAGGVVTVAYRCNGPDAGLVQMVRSTPQGGWGPVASVNTAPRGVFEFHLLPDAAANVVLVLRADLSPSDRIALSTVFDSAQGVWSPLVELGRANAQLELLTLAGDASGQHLMALWLQDQGRFGGRDASLVSVRWSPATRSWGAQETLPGTQAARRSCGGTSVSADTVLLQLDAQGNATAVANLCKDPNSTRNRSLVGLRNENGTWQAPVQLAGNREFVAMAGFGEAVVDARGVFLASQILANSAGERRVSVLRFTPGSGWGVSDIEPWAGFAETVPLAWWGAEGDAVLLQSVPELHGWFSSGGAWSAGPVPAGLGGANSAALLRAPNGDVLAVSTSTTLPALAAAAWLRTP